jgi:TolB-like protein
LAVAFCQRGFNHFLFLVEQRVTKRNCWTSDVRWFLFEPALVSFTNLSGDLKQGYFVDGVTDTLTAELSKISSLQ